MTNYVIWIIELIVICIQLEAIQAQISTANSSITSRSRTCKAPPQPKNGHWQLHRSQCTNGEHCDVPEETELELGSFLIYSCNSGYKLNSSSDAFCSIGGKWHNIPVCLEIRCKPLSTASTEARCTYNDEWVSCESPVLPGTKALLSCQNSYQRDINLFSKDEVRCHTNGEWEPQPIRCIPVCGTLPADVIPLIFGGITPNITEFPWHASMYQEQPDKSKKYFCGATIIQERLLITAAHCVHDEVTKRVIDAGKIYIATGNIFRDYDSSLHDQNLVKKNKVKKIHIMCNYLGFLGNYAWDIAILELVTPFVLSSSLVPACLSPFSDEIVLEPGVYGKVAGFGRTAISETSPILQALTVPYISYSQCKSASQNPNTEQFITIDKFCAGYLNGSSVCDGDSGGGLVVKTNGLWYLRGIVSVSLGTIYKEGGLRCDNNLYTLYTRVFSHVGWIQDVMGTLQQNRLYPSCPIKLWCKPLITSSSTISTDARCIYNGESVSCESPVLPGTTASLSCRSSYRRNTTILSSDEVRCNTNGQWEPEPIQCTSDISVMSNQESFKCPDDFGFYPHHISCDKYWKCDTNVAELKMCGNGLAFNASDSEFLTEDCDYLHNINCSGRTQLEPPISTPHCIRLYGIFPDEKKCDVFWNCWNGEATRYQCSPGLAYDRETRVCMWADQVSECRKEEVAGGFSCPAASEVSGASGLTRHAHSEDCRKYYICLEGIAREYSCPIGSVFKIGDADGSGGCEDPKDVPGCEDYYGDLDLKSIRKSELLARNQSETSRRSERPKRTSHLDSQQTP